MKAVLLFSYFMFLMSGTLFAQNDSSKHKPKDVIEPANLNNPTKPKYNEAVSKG
jgi:hypothetical protein